MGNVSSRQDDCPGQNIYLKDQNRFTLKSLTIANSRKQTLLRVTPNGVPATRLLVRRDNGDERPISYIQDAEAAGTTNSPSFLLKVDLEDELDFCFTFLCRQTVTPAAQAQAVGLQQAALSSSAGGSSHSGHAQDTTISGLTFAYAPTARDLDTLVTREFHADPNLHKNSNVQLVGDLSTKGFPTIESDWTWSWKPPKLMEDKGGGWRHNCSFLEYDAKAHRLNTLASFAFWVQRQTPVPTAVLPPTSFSQNDLLAPVSRHRMPSSQSYQSAVSDSEGGIDNAAPLSPTMYQADYPGMRQETQAKPAVDVGRPTEDMSNVEDGPVFRANMKQLEQKTGNMRVQIKKVLKKAEAAQQAQQDSNEAARYFLAALQEAASSHASAFKPALDHYFANTAKTILKYEEENSVLLRRQIIEPLSKLYTNDIKQVDSKKKDFEDESREYYAYVGRYLGQRQDSLKDKKRAESDSKYQNKKKNFELKRFDYSNFMQDLHGGRKEQELLAQLTKYAKGQAKAFSTAAKQIDELQPQLDALVAEVAEADKEYKIQRTEREEKRRHLEMNTSAANASESEGLSHVDSAVSQSLNTTDSLGYASDTDMSRADSTNSRLGHVARSNLSPSNSQHVATNSLSTSSAAVSGTPASHRFRGFRDLEERDPATSITDRNPVCAPRKEGLLWALSKPGSHIDPKGINKQAWHKFWIVLDQGRLSEYSNWKDRMELHREPIDLRMASVRIARDAERRFCFEVITPHYKRIYQATAEDDMMNWINSINNALQSAFETRDLQAASPPLNKDRTTSEFGAVLTGKSLSQSAPHARGDQSGVNRRVTVGSRPAEHNAVSNAFPEAHTRLLDQIRANDQGNVYCADCGTNSKVEWVSLNLGIILCIECGGIHRSLGTHISKVRSLTLDVSAFTRDIIEILMQVGNRISNMVWEATLEKQSKPEPWASREQRLRFITAKYVEKLYVDKSFMAMHAESPDNNLLMSIKKNDIQGVLQGIAQNANVNIHDRSRNTHAIFLALAAADPARPPSSSGVSASSQTIESATKTFAIAELLIQNGAQIPSELPAIPLSVSAQSYIELKTIKSSTNSDTLGPLPYVTNTKSADQARLQKRGSAGARFAGKVTGLSER